MFIAFNEKRKLIFFSKYDNFLFILKDNQLYMKIIYQNLFSQMYKSICGNHIIFKNIESDFVSLNLGFGEFDDKKTKVRELKNKFLYSKQTLIISSLNFGCPLG